MSFEANRWTKHGLMEKSECAWFQCPRYIISTRSRFGFTTISTGPRFPFVQFGWTNRWFERRTNIQLWQSIKFVNRCSGNGSSNRFVFQALLNGDFLYRKLLTSVFGPIPLLHLTYKMYPYAFINQHITSQLATIHLHTAIPLWLA